MNREWNVSAALPQWQPVLDPNDHKGFKNSLIDRLQWNAVREDLSGSKVLLDFGCGVGRFTERISGLGIAYAGVDISAPMIEEAKKRHPQLAGVFSVIGKGKALPFPDAHFDTFFSSGVFQFIVGTEEEESALAEIRRVLRPAARLLMIEQATVSPKPDKPSEAEYRKAFSARFGSLSIERIRGAYLSRPAHAAMRAAELWAAPYRLGLDALARFERARARRLSDARLARMPYHDVLIRAEAVR